MKKKYRRGVGIFLINKKNQLWVGKRIDTRNDYWQMPQGGIDGAESPEDAMKRELMEETGVKYNYKVIGRTKNWLTYELPLDLVDSVWSGKYLGQQQIWFACRFSGADNQIDINRYGKPEFSSWKWISPSRCLDLVIPFKKDMYRSIMKEFDSLLN
tara:strand:- start:302 stop:769 length:468 start_codon:yes stop_codon:yes gene_type:complete